MAEEIPVSSISKEMAVEILNRYISIPEEKLERVIRSFLRGVSFATAAPEKSATRDEPRYNYSAESIELKQLSELADKLGDRLYLLASKSQEILQKNWPVEESPEQLAFDLWFLSACANRARPLLPGQRGGPRIHYKFGVCADVSISLIAEFKFKSGNFPPSDPDLINLTKDIYRLSGGRQKLDFEAEVKKNYKFLF